MGFIRSTKLGCASCGCSGWCKIVIAQNSFSQCFLNIRMFGTIFIFRNMRQVQQMRWIFVQKENITCDHTEREIHHQKSIVTNDYFRSLECCKCKAPTLRQCPNSYFEWLAYKSVGNLPNYPIFPSFCHQLHRFHR